MTPSVPDQARPEEWKEAWQLLFRHCPPEERSRRAAHAEKLLARGELDPAGLLVIRGPEGLLGATIATVVPGNSGVVWPPQVVDGPDQGAHEDALSRHILCWMQQRGARLGQALLHPDEAHLAAPLLRNGFQHMTTLWYLRHGGQTMRDSLSAVPRLTFQTYGRADGDLFGRTLLRTYEGTLDCAEVAGRRTLDEILAGHQAQGRFDPDRWWLALEGDQAIGVLLIADEPDLLAWEVAYVGVVPEARGRGIGRELMLQALREARVSAIPELFLTVDVRNHPAWHLYQSLGFVPFDCREVFLALWE
jgi:mycothiol synthase